MSDAHVSLVVDGATAVVTLTNPARRNAQTPSMWTALGDIAASLADDVRVVHLRSDGPVFSAGIDLRLLQPDGVEGEPDLLGAAAAGDAASLEADLATYQRAFTAWRNLPAIVIAAVQGAAVGAGALLALAADLRVLADDATMALPETSLGLAPDMGTLGYLVRQIGPERALDLALTGRAMPAAELHALGLATAVVPAKALWDEADALGAAVLRHRPDAVRALKALVRSATHRTAEDQQAVERSTGARLLIDLARESGPQ